MPEPRLKILGVYRPQISAETWQEQWESTGDYTKEHFASLVLIEATVEGLDEPFDMSSFGQPMLESEEDPPNMQVGYDEGLLSADGETMIKRDMDSIHGSGKLRFAVYLHM